MPLPHDFNWIIPDQLGALSLPSAEELGWLREAGVTLLVSALDRRPPESLVQRVGLRLLRLPVEDLHAPTEEQIREFVAEVRAELARGGKVAVHCLGGLGRTGTLIAGYLVSEGMTADEAIDFVRARRPGSVETAEQERALRAWAAKEDSAAGHGNGPQPKP